MAAILRASEATSKAKEGQNFASLDVRYKNKAGSDTSHILEIDEKRAGFKLGKASLFSAGTFHRLRMMSKSIILLNLVDWVVVIEMG